MKRFCTKEFTIGQKLGCHLTKDGGAIVCAQIAGYKNEKCIISFMLVWELAAPLVWYEMQKQLVEPLWWRTNSSNSIRQDEKQLML